MTTHVPRVGRRPATTRDQIAAVAMELFTEHGFDEVSVDDVAEAAGIARRTLFRYYSSKNAIVWGDFDSHLEMMRNLLNDTSESIAIDSALRQALLTFNEFPAGERARHRTRMRMILEIPTLQAYSMLMYTGWREVIAEFVASRMGRPAQDLVPQTVGWVMLGVALAAYEQWLADDTSSLCTLLGDGFDTVGAGLCRLEDRR